MTDCNLEPIRFPSCKGRLVEASFSGGAVLLRQADRMPGLADRRRKASSRRCKRRWAPTSRWPALPRCAASGRGKGIEVRLAARFRCMFINIRLNRSAGGAATANFRFREFLRRRLLGNMAN